MTKKSLSQRTEEKKKYRIKKTTRDVNAILGVDYAPEVFDNGIWITLSPAWYNEEDALQVLRTRKNVDVVKVEYIYPNL